MENKSDKNTPNGTIKMSGSIQTYDEAVLTVIDREYGSLRNGAKILARHARSSIAAAQKWIYGSRVPTGDYIVNIMAECPVMYEEIERLIAERRKALSTSRKE